VDKADAVNRQIDPCSALEGVPVVVATAAVESVALHSLVSSTFLRVICHLAKRHDFPVPMLPLLFGTPRLLVHCQ
jgi:hypothetical protein